jgi:hypothetical protein
VGFVDVFRVVLQDEEPSSAPLLGPDLDERKWNLAVDQETRDEVHTPRNSGQSWTVGHQDFRRNGGAFFRFGSGWVGVWFDVLSGLVVFFGLKIAVKPPDADHPYGHGKAEPIAALCVDLSLIAAAVAIMRGKN